MYLVRNLCQNNKELSKLKKKTNSPIKNLKKYFSEECLLITNRYVQRCLLPFDTREMKLKITVRYHITLHLLRWINQKAVRSVEKDTRNLEFLFIIDEIFCFSISGISAYFSTDTGTYFICTHIKKYWKESFAFLHYQQSWRKIELWNYKTNIIKAFRYPQIPMT